MSTCAVVSGRSPHVTPPPPTSPRLTPPHFASQVLRASGRSGAAWIHHPQRIKGPGSRYVRWKAGRALPVGRRYPQDHQDEYHRLVSHAHTQIHTCTRTYIHTHAHTHTHARRAHAHTHARTHTHAHTHTRSHAHDMQRTSTRHSSLDPWRSAPRPPALVSTHPPTTISKPFPLQSNPHEPALCLQLCYHQLGRHRNSSLLDRGAHAPRRGADRHREHHVDDLHTGSSSRCQVQHCGHGYLPREATARLWPYGRHVWVTRSPPVCGQDTRTRGVGSSERMSLLAVRNMKRGLDGWRLGVVRWMWVIGHWTRSYTTTLSAVQQLCMCAARA